MFKREHVGRSMNNVERGEEVGNELVIATVLFFIIIVSTRYDRKLGSQGWQLEPFTCYD